MVQLWRICAVFFGFFLSLPVDAGVEPAETVFKGVELMHITLSLAAFTTACRCVPHYVRGSSPAPLLGILFLTLVPDTLLC
jgi:hypothetical protein